MIILSLIVGVFLVWLFKQDWLLNFLAAIISIVTGVVGIGVGVVVYKGGGYSYTRWARVTAAIILGLATDGVVTELTHSHKLVRFIENQDTQLMNRCFEAMVYDRYAVQLSTSQLQLLPLFVSIPVPPALKQFIPRPIH